jgi:hypothetical protein
MFIIIYLLYYKRLIYVYIILLINSTNFAGAEYNDRYFYETSISINIINPIGPQYSKDITIPHLNNAYLN